MLCGSQCLVYAEAQVLSSQPQIEVSQWVIQNTSSSGVGDTFLIHFSIWVGIRAPLSKKSILQRIILKSLALSHPQVHVLMSDVSLGQTHWGAWVGSSVVWEGLRGDQRKHPWWWAWGSKYFLQHRGALKSGAKFWIAHSTLHKKWLKPSIVL